MSDTIYCSNPDLSQHKIEDLYDYFCKHFEVGDYIAHRQYETGELYISRIKTFRRTANNQGVIVHFTDSVFKDLTWYDLPCFLKKVKFI